MYAARADTGHPEIAYLSPSGRPWFDLQHMIEWARAWDERKKSGLTEVDRTGDPDELLDIHEAAALLGFSSFRTIASYRSRNVGYFPEPDMTTPGRRGPMPLWTRRTLWTWSDRRSRPGRAGRGHQHRLAEPTVGKSSPVPPHPVAGVDATAPPE
jgi:hypothetical protein